MNEISRDKTEELPVFHTTGRLTPRAIGSLLIPSFLHHQKTPLKLHSTSWLDGARGIACMIVVTYHHSLVCHQRGLYGYGEVGFDYAIPGVPDFKKAENRYIMQLPFFRLLHAGSAMVSLFFVISGYALSFNLIGLLRKQRWPTFLSKLTSSAFRRPIRLFGPVMVSSFIKAALTFLGVYELTREFRESPAIFNKPDFAPRLPLFQQLWDWFTKTPQFLDILNYVNGQFPLYAQPTWTIPREVKYSFVLYIQILTLSRAKTATRISLLAASSIWSIRSYYWETFCFTWGIILAELDVIRQENVTEDLTKAPQSSIRFSKRLGSQMRGLLFIISLYLLGFPERHSERTPGYVFVTKINILAKDEFRFWPSVGSVIFLWVVGTSPTLQKLFTNAFSQYLGRISFAVYLVHVFILDTAGLLFLQYAWSITGIDTMVGHELGWCLSYLGMLPIIICVADVFWRLVDLKCLALSRWVENKFCVA
ncbi:hypothetical protein HYFRA_00009375 [Hymenoscyphus fraxineus]|uniref:Acyltransferase 3 domain-containing protein n=1 Tax=Hymenoscyphus fraxineus TaxID=746836 RepID=A0A9N9L132_9HELO|nr:hypothetical protein HYFRA_00009375 [Hymenoscyphus fraxineus]